MDPVRTAILGCGTISDVYFAADERFDAFELVACADVEAERARAAAAEHGLRAHSVDGLLADDAVELVVNLTPPAAHAETCERLLAAGTHVYVEKPLAATPEAAGRIRATAADRGLLVGAAPDTVLGGGLQTARSALDDGLVGDPVGATAVWVSGGHESWHPAPEFYYQPGGGPLLDMGPYYLTALVALLGPVRRVTGATARTFDERTIGSEPRRGESIDVAVPTHESAVVEFESGATATLTTSFDAPGESTLPSPAFELYGTEGTLALPDPNTFEGPVRVRHPDEESVRTVPATHDYAGGRGAGVADLALAIRDDDGGPAWEHRTTAALAEHVLTALAGVREAATSGTHVDVESSPDRPAPLPPAFPDVTG